MIQIKLPKHFNHTHVLVYVKGATSNLLKGTKIDPPLVSEDGVLPEMLARGYDVEEMLAFDGPSDNGFYAVMRVSPGKISD